MSITGYLSKEDVAASINSGVEIQLIPSRIIVVLTGVPSSVSPSPYKASIEPAANCHIITSNTSSLRHIFDM